VNDAPAIKGADVGVAVGSGTDVAKETSDIILLNDNLATLVAAVREGRISFDNIRKVTLYLLADAFSEILLIGGALIIGLPIPILAAQILWINLVEDGLPVSALAFEPGEKEVMQEKPRKLTEPIIDYEMKVIIFAIGFINDILILIFYWWMFNQGNIEMDKIRTIVFVTLSIDALLYVFSCRSMRHTVLTMNPFSNRLLNIAVVIGASLMVSGVYFPPFQTILRTVPLTAQEWIKPIIIAVISVILIEIVKGVFIVRVKNKKLKNKKA
jgi:Ca2+-transporting ATPase